MRNMEVRRVISDIKSKLKGTFFVTEYTAADLLINWLIDLLNGQSINLQ